MGFFKTSGVVRETWELKVAAAAAVKLTDMKRHQNLHKTHT